MQIQRKITTRVINLARTVHWNHTYSKVVAKKVDTHSQIDFSYQANVFRHKSTRDLIRNLAILKICSFNSFVDNALPVMRRFEGLLGQKVFSLLVRPTFYKQFVGGDTEQELRETCDKLKEANLRLMVCPAMEEDVGETGAEDKYQYNMEYILEIGKMMRRAGEEQPCLQFKVTAFMPGDLMKVLTTHIGTSTQLESLAEMIATSIETENHIRIGWLSETENDQLNQGIDLIRRFGARSKELDLKLLVDAEYTYMNPGIAAVALGMMLAFNKEKPVVWNTYQCYLKESFAKISQELKIIEDRNRCFGAKIVRGAYLEKERKLAKLGQYPDPVNETYEATGLMYDRVVKFMLTHIKEAGPRCNIVLGTHNESSIVSAAQHMEDMDIPPDAGLVVFGQIYGMGDQISLPLSKAGFTVYKSVPYGPLWDVLPYLSRRAAENRVVLAGARRELELLQLELKHRLLSLVMRK